MLSCYLTCSLVYIEFVQGTGTYPQFYCEFDIYVTSFNMLINELMIENSRFTLLRFTCAEAARDAVASSNLQTHSLNQNVMCTQYVVKHNLVSDADKLDNRHYFSLVLVYIVWQKRQWTMDTMCNINTVYITHSLLD